MEIVPARRWLCVTPLSLSPKKNQLLRALDGGMYPATRASLNRTCQTLCTPAGMACLATAFAEHALSPSGETPGSFGRRFPTPGAGDDAEGRPTFEETLSLESSKRLAAAAATAQLPLSHREPFVQRLLQLLREDGTSRSAWTSTTRRASSAIVGRDAQGVTADDILSLLTTVDANQRGGGTGVTLDEIATFLTDHYRLQHVAEDVNMLRRALYHVESVVPSTGHCFSDMRVCQRTGDLVLRSSSDFCLHSLRPHFGSTPASVIHTRGGQSDAGEGSGDDEDLDVNESGVVQVVVPVPAPNPLGGPTDDAGLSTAAGGGTVRRRHDAEEGSSAVPLVAGLSVKLAASVEKRRDLERCITLEPIGSVDVFALSNAACEVVLFDTNVYRSVTVAMRTSVRVLSYLGEWSLPATAFAWKESSSRRAARGASAESSPRRGLLACGDRDGWLHFLVASETTPLRLCHAIASPDEFAAAAATVAALPPSRFVSVRCCPQPSPVTAIKASASSCARGGTALWDASSACVTYPDVIVVGTLDGHVAVVRATTELAFVASLWRPCGGEGLRLFTVASCVNAVICVTTTAAIQAISIEQQPADGGNATSQPDTFRGLGGDRQEPPLPPLGVVEVPGRPPSRAHIRLASSSTPSGQTCGALSIVTVPVSRCVATPLPPSVDAVSAVEVLECIERRRHLLTVDDRGVAHVWAATTLQCVQVLKLGPHWNLHIRYPMRCVCLAGGGDGAGGELVVITRGPVALTLRAADEALRPERATDVLHTALSWSDRGSSGSTPSPRSRELVAVLVVHERAVVSWVPPPAHAGMGGAAPSLDTPTPGRGTSTAVGFVVDRALPLSVPLTCATTTPDAKLIIAGDVRGRLIVLNAATMSIVQVAEPSATAMASNVVASPESAAAHGRHRHMAIHSRHDLNDGVIFRSVVFLPWCGGCLAATSTGRLYFVAIMRRDRRDLESSAHRPSRALLVASDVGSTIMTVVLQGIGTPTTSVGPTTASSNGSPETPFAFEDIRSTLIVVIGEESIRFFDARHVRETGYLHPLGLIPRARRAPGRAMSRVEAPRAAARSAADGPSVALTTVPPPEVLCVVPNRDVPRKGALYVITSEEVWAVTVTDAKGTSIDAVAPAFALLAAAGDDPAPHSGSAKGVTRLAQHKAVLAATVVRNNTLAPDSLPTTRRSAVRRPSILIDDDLDGILGTPQAAAAASVAVGGRTSGHPPLAASHLSVQGHLEVVGLADVGQSLRVPWKGSAASGTVEKCLGGANGFAFSWYPWALLGPHSGGDDRRGEPSLTAKAACQLIMVTPAAVHGAPPWPVGEHGSAADTIPVISDADCSQPAAVFSWTTDEPAVAPQPEGPSTRPMPSSASMLLLHVAVVTRSGHPVLITAGLTSRPPTSPPPAILSIPRESGTPPPPRSHSVFITAETTAPSTSSADHTASDVVVQPSSRGARSVSLFNIDAVGPPDDDLRRLTSGRDALSVVPPVRRSQVSVVESVASMVVTCGSPRWDIPLNMRSASSIWAGASASDLRSGVSSAKHRTALMPHRLATVIGDERTRNPPPSAASAPPGPSGSGRGALGDPSSFSLANISEFERCVDGEEVVADVPCPDASTGEGADPSSSTGRSARRMVPAELPPVIDYRFARSSSTPAWKTEWWTAELANATQFRRKRLPAAKRR